MPFKKYYNLERKNKTKKPTSSPIGSLACSSAAMVDDFVQNDTPIDYAPKGAYRSKGESS